jgi:hypothetical protein
MALLPVFSGKFNSYCEPAGQSRPEQVRSDLIEVAKILIFINPDLAY